MEGYGQRAYPVVPDFLTSDFESARSSIQRFRNPVSQAFELKRRSRWLVWNRSPDFSSGNCERAQRAVCPMSQPDLDPPYPYAIKSGRRRARPSTTRPQSHCATERGRDGVSGVTG